jgi:hypothetical protein
MVTTKSFWSCCITSPTLSLACEIPVVVRLPTDTTVSKRFQPAALNAVHPSPVARIAVSTVYMKDTARKSPAACSFVSTHSSSSGGRRGPHLALASTLGSGRTSASCAHHEQMRALGENRTHASTATCMKKKTVMVRDHQPCLATARS